MKKIAVLLLVFSSLLSGCVVYDRPGRWGDNHREGHDDNRGRADRDHDGVRDKHDRRPNDPGRY